MFGSKKQRLLKLQNLMMPGHNHLLMSESQLLNQAAQICSQRLKILNDSASIVNSTTNVDTFFSRYDLLYEEANYLVPFEPFVAFRGSTPTQLIEQFDAKYDSAIMDLINRCYEATRNKAEAMKTEKGRVNQFVKLFLSLAEYELEMNEETLLYIQSLKESMIANISDEKLYSETKALISRPFPRATPKPSYAQQTEINVIVPNTAQSVSATSQHVLKRNRNVAVFLCIFFGIFGAHKFYEDKNFLGTLYIATFGFCLIGVIVDLILLCSKPNPYYC